MNSVAAPFRGLDPYTDSADDAALFFGRDDEIRIAAANLLTSRLTLLYGPSGVGKSSLLRAGLAHRLRQADDDEPTRRAVVVMDDWGTDPAAELVRRARAAAGDGDGAGADGAAVDAALREVVREHEVELLLILDQFEEYLTRAPVGALDDAIAALADARGVPIRLLIALREDALALLDRFKGDVPGLFDNYLRLDDLDREAALAAIHGPVAHYNAGAAAPVALEDGLAEEVVRQLAAGELSIVERAPERGGSRPERVEPAHLQIVMRRLWEAEAAAGSTRLRRATLDGLGGAEAVLRAHLREAMGALPAADRQLAFRVMNLLVTPSGLKVRHTAGDLAGYVGAPHGEVRGLLEALAGPRVRVLRKTAPPPGADEDAAFELFHDVLAPAVLDWRTEHQALERRRLEVRSRRLTAALIAVSAVAAGLVLYAWGPEPLRRAELATVDWRWAVHGDDGPPRDIVLVGIDAASVRELGGGLPLPRGLHARVLDRIDGDGPRAIVYDVIFQRRLPGPDSAALEAALQRAAPRLVLAAFDFRVTGGEVQTPLLGRADFAQRAGIRVGYSGIPDDPDGVLRRVDYDVSPAAGVHMPTLALQGARVATGEDLDAADLPAAPRHRSRTQSPRTGWIAYRGGPGTIRTVSFSDVLRDRVPGGAFRDKVVVVGTTAPEGGDVHETPVNGGRRMSGPEVQANAVDTVLRGIPLRDAPALVDVLLIAALGVLPVAAGATTGLVRRVALVAGAAVLLVVAAQLAFEAGRIIAVLVPLLVLAVSTAAVLAAALLRRRPERNPA